MTLPNKLTLARILTTPPIFAAWYLAFPLGLLPLAMVAALWVLLVFGEVTDFLDGRIARKYNLVSETGKIMDPFVDVLFRLTYFVCFVSSGIMPVWAFMIILWRELGIMTIRALLLQKGIVMAAGFWGKLKAGLYCITGLGGMLVLTAGVWSTDVPWLDGAVSAVWIISVVAALAALLSFVDYFMYYLKARVRA